MNKEAMKNRLTILIDDYKKQKIISKTENISEETIRGWINEFISIFGWDVKNTNEIIQEKKLLKKHTVRLTKIDSSHTKPDYYLVNGPIIKSFIDAKDIKVSVEDDRAAAFQIRSYGWSAEISYAFVTNFEELGIYDCRFLPSPEQDANLGRIYYKMDDYIDNFDTIYDHLFKDNMLDGKLLEKYSQIQVEGDNKLDINFTNFLSKFRMELAVNIKKYNSPFIGTDHIMLNYYVQVVMGRIIFLRVCESRGIEEEATLKKFLDEGFWDIFKQSCYMDYYEHYDGSMFERDSRFSDLKIDDAVFENFVKYLYYPSPYKFDVIPVRVISNIYEQFLAKQLVIDNGKVKEVLKGEYVKSQGAVSTPKHIVESVCKRTIELNKKNTIEELLNIKILDPACGSGVFLITCFELLENKIIALYSSDKVDDKYNSWFIIGKINTCLTVDAKREIMKSCLHGIDYDEVAIEVTKMSMALKIIDNNEQVILNEVGVFGSKILREINNNVKLGNTLVENDVELSEDDFNAIKPLDVRGLCFRSVFLQKGGFDYIVGNPPYVETKHYKKLLPEMHNYISNKYSTFTGKADLSIIFIERSLQLLNQTGRMGFIVQKRFFKTNYGEKIRSLISDNKYLSNIVDFKTEKLFYKKITYIAIVILDKSQCDYLKYEYIDLEPLDIEKVLIADNEYVNIIKPINIPSGYVTKKPWSFESHIILPLIKKLRDKFGTFGNYPNMYIKGGIQALWKRAYHLTNCCIKDNLLKGRNGWGEIVVIEKDIMKVVVYNKNFYCFKEVVPDAYCLFPYDNENPRLPLKMSQIKSSYPLAYEYLRKKENLIKANVNTYEDDELWPRFTREHNHDSYYDNKIILPMTAYDTIATCIESRGLYMDNSNVWFVKVDDANSLLLKAITSIINSTIFSVLATAEANPQSGGYYKLNKQFLLPVPFPTNNIKSDSINIACLSELYDLIYKAQKDYKETTPNRKLIAEGLLNNLWQQLDNITYELYELTDEEIELIKSIGRRTDRIELIL